MQKICTFAKSKYIHYISQEERFALFITCPFCNASQTQIGTQGLVLENSTQTKIFRVISYTVLSYTVSSLPKNNSSSGLTDLFLENSRSQYLYSIIPVSITSILNI